MPNVLSKLRDAILMPEWTFAYNCHEVGHTWNPSCTQSAFDVSKVVLREGFLMYTALYTASLVTVHRKFDKKSIEQTLISILTSTSFIFFNSYSMFLFFCGLRKLSGKFYYSLVSTIPAFCGSLMAIHIERPSRRVALAFYCANIASECLFRIGVSRKYWKPIANGETLLFAVSMATLLYIIRKKGFGKDPISFVLKLILGRSESKQRANTNGSSLIRESKALDIANNKIVKMNQSEQRQRHISCTHMNESCFEYVIKGFIKPLFIGWLGQSLFSVLIKPKRFLNDPYSLIKSLRSERNVRFGLFAASFSALFKAINCSLRWQRDKSEDWHAFVAGLVASSSMLISPSKNIATNVTWKCIETIFFLGVRSGIVPCPDTIIAIIYAISVNIMFYTVIIEPSSLRPSYLRFVERFSDHKLNLFNRVILSVFGGDACKGFEDYFPDLNPQKCTHQFVESVLVWLL